MTIKDVLTRWNGGVYRGAAKRLSVKTGVDKTVLSRWIRSKLILGEKSLARVAKELACPVAQLRAMFEADQQTGTPAKISDILEIVTRMDRRLTILERAMQGGNISGVIELDKRPLPRSPGKKRWGAPDPAKRGEPFP